MTHRLDIRHRDAAVTLEFQGLLDAAALEGLGAAVASARRRGTGRVRVVLRAGTDVDRACLPALRALDAELVAEAAYLASWLANAK